MQPRVPLGPKLMGDLVSFGQLSHENLRVLVDAGYAVPALGFYLVLILRERERQAPAGEIASPPVPADAAG